MPNQLSVPFKKSYVEPIKQATRDYIQNHHTDTHPDAFRQDIAHWEKLRADGTGGMVNVAKVEPMLRYHAQLVFILTKLPANMGLTVHYAPAFTPSQLPLQLKNLLFERAAVLFNLGALYSQLASAEDRSTPDGLKRAIGHYQSSAGVFDYLRGTVLPKLIESLEAGQQVPAELTDEAVESLKLLMRAQAQECIWQTATLNNNRNGIISRLAMQTSQYYAKSLLRLSDAPYDVRQAFPSSWLAHIETKQNHFEAAAQFRKSREAQDLRKFGIALGRLKEARALAQKGYDTARRGGVAPAVLSDIKNLLTVLEKEEKSAEKDNDLIYHEDVPPPTMLEAIAPIAMANVTVPAALIDPKKVLEQTGETVIFENLVSWGAGEAINIYKDRRENLLDLLGERALELDNAITEAYKKLSLPASLDALERPIGLPPSLLQKAEEVQSKNGPDQIERLLESVQELGTQNRDLLEEAVGILDQEAQEDEDFQERTPGVRRPTSEEVNIPHIKQYQKFLATLDNAAQSDRIVDNKWMEWEDAIGRLMLDEAELEKYVPSSTGSSSSADTRKRARTLRRLMERLDETKAERAEQLARARRRAETDDVQPRIMREAAGRERWAEVTPAMFQEVVDEELGKYDKFRRMVEEGAESQAEAVVKLQSAYEAFMQSRKEDSSMKEREHALQSLELGYHKYIEITRHLNEAVEFYNKLAGMITKFKDTCKAWAHERREDMRDLTDAMQTISIAEEQRPEVTFHEPAHTPAPAPRQPVAEAPITTAPATSTPACETPPRLPSPPRAPPVVAKTSKAPAFHLPPPGSDMWEAIPVPVAPGSIPRTKKKVKNAA